MATQRIRSRDWPLGRRLALFSAALLITASFGLALLLDSGLGLRTGPNEFNIAAWEFRNFPAKWLYEAGELFRPERSLEEQNEDIARFLALTSEIEALERNGETRDEARLRELSSERDTIENRVEDTIEDRISAIVEEEGLTRSFLFLPQVVWPPVDLEFTDSPSTLAISPRDRISLNQTSLLREDLSIEEIEAIEDGKKERDNLAALAFATSGIGAYPTIVDYTSDYRRAIEVSAHEWMHNYLFFRPLGFNYYANNDLRTMNETVADLAGREVANAVVARWPLAEAGPEPANGPADSASPQPETPDVGVFLRELRAEVEEMLAVGQIEEAETLMEARRGELAEQGVFIRKINQAYFAFTNLYAGEAGSPAAVNPIGPKIDELRRRTASLGQFVSIAGELTSVRELDEALLAIE